MATEVSRRTGRVVVEERTGAADRAGAIGLGAVLLFLSVAVPRQQHWTGLAQALAWTVFGSGGLLLVAYALLAPRRRLEVDGIGRALLFGSGHALSPWSERRWPLAAVAEVDLATLPREGRLHAYALKVTLHDGTRLTLGRLLDLGEAERLVNEFRLLLPAGPRPGPADW